MTSTAALPAEVNLLLACARTGLDTETADRIRILVQDNVDWDYLVKTAFRHGVLPLVFRNLERVCPHAVPPGAMNELRAQFQANAAHNLFLTGELLKLLSTLDERGVKALPFKGPLLSFTTYGDLSLRQFSDLDILVHPKDLENTRSVIAAQGFKPWLNLTDIEEAAWLRSEHAYTFVREDGKVRVDLHWSIAQRHYSFGFDAQDVWERLEPIWLGGRHVASLHPEDLLLYLCIHGSKHCWERLAWICDVAELIRSRQDMDWNKIMNRSRVHNAERVLFVALYLARELLETPLPENILVNIENDPSIKKVSFYVQRRLSVKDYQPLGAIEKTALLLRMRERLQNKLPFLLYRLCMVLGPNEKDIGLVPLPTFLYWFYYPLRMLRLATAYTVSALGAFKANQNRSQ